MNSLYTLYYLYAPSKHPTDASAPAGATTFMAADSLARKAGHPCHSWLHTLAGIATSATRPPVGISTLCWGRWGPQICKQQQHNQQIEQQTQQKPQHACTTHSHTQAWSSKVLCSGQSRNGNRIKVHIHVAYYASLHPVLIHVACYYTFRRASDHVHCRS
jgi:hypothetical protein